MLVNLCYYSINRELDVPNAGFLSLEFAGGWKNWDWGAVGNRHKLFWRRWGRCMDADKVLSTWTGPISSDKVESFDDSSHGLMRFVEI